MLRSIHLTSSMVLKFKIATSSRLIGTPRNGMNRNIAFLLSILI